MATYAAVNLENNSGDMAPVIYNVDANGYLNGVFMSWQAADGSSASGDLEADIEACRAELSRLSAAGHEI